MIHLIIFLLLTFAVSLVAVRLDGSIITGAMIFTLAGVASYFAAPLFGAEQPNLVAISFSHKLILQLGEITLAIVLFGDATRISIRQAITASPISARLLLIGMPLTILFGIFVTYGWFRDALPFWEAAILATILAPTDASLGAVVVNSKQVPVHIREALSVESGLNDGLSMPFFVLFLGLAGYELHESSIPWLQYTLMQIGFGVLVGFLIGWIGGRLMAWSDGRHWMHEGAHLVTMLSLALLAWASANTLGGNGFIAAFMAGASLRWSYDAAARHVEDFEESWGRLLVYFIFFAFGLLAAPQLHRLTPTIWLYGVLSLTVIRMIPVALSLIGARLDLPTILFLGWFGPRGLASIVLGLIYLEESTFFKVNPIILLVVIATVLLSVVAHGVTAAPFSNLYARYLSKPPANSAEPA